MSSSIFIIVLQYNNSRDTIKCLESVKELDWQNFKAVVVDNASEIQHLNNIRLFVESQKRAKEKRFKLIENRSNLGYAGGNNVGIKYALENGADYVFILNPDTTVRSNFLTKLIETADKNPKAGIIGAVINEGDRIIYYGEIEWLKPELKHSALKPITYNLKPDFYVPGAAMLIRKKVFEKIGMFDERYFLYFEDADFCMRARKAGFKLAVAPDAIVRHDQSSSTSKLGAALLLRYHYRNAHLFNIKYAPFWTKISLPFWSIWIIIRQAVKILLIRNIKASKAILIGVLDFYKCRFGKIVLDTNSRIKNE